MNKHYFLALGLGLATFASAQDTGIPPVDPNRVVATVNGIEIRGTEYYRRMEFLPGVNKRMGNSYAEFPPGFLTLEELITEKLVLQLAKEKGVTPTQNEIDNELRLNLERDPKALVDWNSGGRTRQELLDAIKYDVARFKLATFGINITDQEVEAFYKDHPLEFTAPKRVHLRVIVVADAAKRDIVDRDLTAGKKFSDVASEQSMDVSKLRGGDFGVVVLANLNKDAQEAIGKVMKGQMTSWVSSSGLFLRFLVEDIFPEQLQPLDAQLKRAIRRRLMLQKGSNKNDVAKDMAELRSRSKVDIKEKLFADAYQRFIDAYLKLQQAASNGG